MESFIIPSLSSGFLLNRFSVCVCVFFSFSVSLVTNANSPGNGQEEAEYKLLPSGPSNDKEKDAKPVEQEVSIFSKADAFSQNAQC